MSGTGGGGSNTPSGTPPTVTPPAVDENEETEPLGLAGRGRRHPFFQRSDSTLCLGCTAPDPFDTPMARSLPLADQPHLLQPNATRDELFGIPKIPGPEQHSCKYATIDCV